MKNVDKNIPEFQPFYAVLERHILRNFLLFFSKFTHVLIFFTLCFTLIRPCADIAHDVHVRFPRVYLISSRVSPTIWKLVNSRPVRDNGVDDERKVNVWLTDVWSIVTVPLDPHVRSCTPRAEPLSCWRG